MDQSAPSASAAPAPVPARRLLPAVGLVSFAMLLFEMTFFQVVHHLSNYILAVYSIAIALMGLIAGGVIAFLGSGLLARRPAILAWIPVAMSAAIGLSLVDVMWLHTVDWLYFFASGLLVFLLAGVFLSHAFVLHDSYRIYAADMIGAGLGVVGSVVLVRLLLEENSILVSLALPLIAGGLVASRRRGLVAGVAGALALLVLVAFNHDTGLFNAVRDASPNRFTNPTALTRAGHDHIWVTSRSSMSGRLDFAKPRVEPDPAWDIPENPLGIDTPFVRTFLSNRSLDGVNTKRGEDSVPDVRVPEAMFDDPPAILIIGAAAQGVVKEAVVLGGGRATAVEINPATIEVMTGDLDAYSRHAYRGLDLTQIDVRTLLMETDARFDLITMLNLHNYYIGTDPIPESPFTVEAIASYFDHLTDRGVIDIEEMIHKGQTRAAVQKELANFARVLVEQGLSDDPGRHFYAYRWRRSHYPDDWWFYQFLVKKTPLSSDDITRMDAWVARFNTDEMTAEAVYPARSDKHSLVAEAMDYRSFAPLTDDAPFNVAPSELQTVLNGMTIILALLGLIVLALPLRRFIRAARQAEGTWPLALYFLASGFAYMGFEITIFQKNQTYMGSVGMSLVISTAVMMACSGLGSLAAGRLSARSRLWSITAIPLAIAGLGLLVGPLFAWSGFWFESGWLRALMVLLLIGPASFLMGMPFAAGMDVVRARTGEVYATTMFAINGVAASLGTLVAFNLSIHYGYPMLLWSSVCLYGLVAALAWLALRPRTAA